MIPLKVLGHRVLVKPDINANAPETLASGITIAKSLAAAVTGDDPTVSVHRGTVVALGTLRHPRWQEATTLAEKVERFAARGETEHRTHAFLDAAHMLRDLVRVQPSVAVGDDVLFSHDAGQQITLDDDTYVLLQDGELLAVVEPEPVSV